MPADVGTIEAALDSAAAGDSVVVAAGTYLEHGLLLKSGVVIHGATGDPADVVIDAQSLGRLFDGVGLSAGRLEALTLANGQAPSTPPTDDRGGAIRLKASSGLVLANCAFTGNTAAHGAAIACEGSSPTIEGCTFEGNEAVDSEWATAGAIRIDGAAPIVRACAFTGNTAFATATLGDGGAIFAKRSSAVIEDCVFVGNSSGAGGGAAYSWDEDASVWARCTFEQNVADAGGAMYVETAVAEIVDCDFESNTAQNGGALFIDQQSDPRIRGSRFHDNTATPNAGGAVDAWASTPEFHDCTFTANSANGRGGALSFNGESDALVRGCTFAGNVAGSAGGAMRLAWTATVRVESSTILESGGGAIRVQDWSTLLVDRSIIAFGASGKAIACTDAGTAGLIDSDVWGNPGGDWTDCIVGQLGSNGNVSADPLLCDRPGGEYGLTLPDSPCLPQNSASGVLIGRWPAGCGCPPDSGFDVVVPGDHSTIAAAIAAARPGETIGVCAGTYPEALRLREGVHLVGAAANLCRVEWPGAGAEPALLWASGIVESTVVAQLTFDAGGGVAQVVLAESTSTGLQLSRNVVTGGQLDGIVNGPDSFVRIGGALELANDIFGNGGVAPRNVRNLNVTADSLDALLNFWGTTRYDSILATIEGNVRSCPITDSTHTKELCAPLTTVTAPGFGEGPSGLRASPNPFRGSCRIQLATREAGAVRLSVFDVRGRRVANLHRGLLPAGPHAVVWDGRGGDGRPLAPGIYFLRLEGGGAVATRKVVLLR